jgi:regulator of replication initiation timing
MKKVCTRCGGQLSIAERQCTSCGAFNPFFISSFKSQRPVNVEIGALEEQLLATEENEHGNGINEVRKELQQLDEENKRLKQEVEILNKRRAEEQILRPKTQENSNTKSTLRKRILVFASIFLIGLGISLGYFYGFNKNSLSSEAKASNPNTGQLNHHSGEQNLAMAGNAPGETPVRNDSTPVNQIAVAKTTPQGTNPVKMTAKKDGTITEAKVKNDLVGNKLSGCGITVTNPREIISCKNLVLVKKETSGEAKYKFVTRVSKGSEIYTATPYIYYDAKGVFLRIDGTNCE